MDWLSVQIVPENYKFETVLVKGEERVGLICKTCSCPPEWTIVTIITGSIELTFMMHSIGAHENTPKHQKAALIESYRKAAERI